MSIVIDTEPPPPASLREMVDGLSPGQSLLTPNTDLSVLRTTVSRVRRRSPTRRFRTQQTPEGPRVWRTA